MQIRYLQSSVGNRLGFPGDMVPSPELMLLMCPFSNGDRKLPRLAIERSQQPEDVPEIAVGPFVETPREPDSRLDGDDLALPYMLTACRPEFFVSGHIFYTGYTFATSMIRHVPRTRPREQLMSHPLRRSFVAAAGTGIGP